MDYTFLERLKTKVISGAQTSAARIEDAARTGKLHLDLMAARRKLQRAYTDLGKEAHTALGEGTMDAFARRPGIPELQIEIGLHKREIEALEGRLAEAKDNKAGKPGKSA
jgi:hypothetical protein